MHGQNMPSSTRPNFVARPGIPTTTSMAAPALPGQPAVAGRRVLYRVPTITEEVAAAGAGAGAPAAEAGASSRLLEKLAAARYEPVMESAWGEELEVKDEIGDATLLEKLLPWRFFCACERAATTHWLQWACDQMVAQIGQSRLVSFIHAVLHKAAYATFDSPDLFPAVRAVTPKNFAILPPKDPVTVQREKRKEQYERMLAELEGLRASERRLTEEIAEWMKVLETLGDRRRGVSEHVSEFIRDVEDYLDGEPGDKFDDCGVAELDFFNVLRKKNERAKLAAIREFEAIMPYTNKRFIERTINEADKLGMYEDIYDDETPDELPHPSGLSSPIHPKNSASSTRSPHFSRAFLARSSMAVLREETR